MIKEVDVLVIGAGIAGSMAARESSRNGAKTLIIEKKSEIGTPKRCAEGISKKTLENLKINLDERWIARKINGAKIVSPDNTTVSFTPETLETNAEGYILERKVFDKHITMDAIRNGAEIYLKTEAIHMERDIKGSFIVTLDHDPLIKVKASIVIGADGPEGHVGRWAGLNTHIPLQEMESGIQYEMCNLELENPDILGFYFGSIAPGGYAWIFPKGYDCANVGIDVSSIKANKPAIEYLDEFVKNCPETKNGQIVEINAGGNPLCGVFDEIISDNIMLVGDAAGCVNPITGGGIDTALESGKIAGQIAAKSIKSRDYSKEALKEYDNYINEHIQNKFKKLITVRDFIYNLNDNDLNEYAKALNKTEIKTLTTKTLVKALIKTSPRKLIKLAKLIF